MLHEDMGRPGFPVITAERRQKFLDSSLTLTAAPQGHSELRRQLSEPLWMLFAVTAVLLGLVCLNVSGLFLARASTRAREIATRLALGASSGRLARQLVAESLLIALAGGLLGIAAAPIAVRVLIAFIPQGTGASALHAGSHEESKSNRRESMCNRGHCEWPCSRLPVRAALTCVVTPGAK